MKNLPRRITERRLKIVRLVFLLNPHEHSRLILLVLRGFLHWNKIDKITIDSFPTFFHFISIQTFMWHIGLIFSSHTNFSSISIECFLIRIIDKLIEKQVLEKSLNEENHSKRTHLRIEIRDKCFSFIIKRN